MLDDWPGTLDTRFAVERDDGLRRLAPVVCEEEIRGGCEAAPGAAHRAAAKDVLGRKADKDLPPQDLLRECGGGSGDAAAARPRSYSCGCRFRGGLITPDRRRVLDAERYDDDPVPPRDPNAGRGVRC